MDIFTDYLKSKSTLSAKEISRIRSAATPMHFRRRQQLLREGEFCRGYAFITKGCFRIFRTGEEGKEVILRFGIENWWLSDLESLDLRQPSKNTIEALETSDVLFWPTEVLDSLRQELPAFMTLLDKLKTRSFLTTQQRIIANLSLTAEQRYQDFLAAYPEVFNRVPLHMVAAYLGMTRKTISRIRAGYAH